MKKIKSTSKQYGILLVEDNKDDVFLTELAIKESNINAKLLTIDNGKTAIQLLNDLASNCRKLPGLILLDINLPKVTGLEVLKKIKSQLATSSIPTVIFTSSDSQIDMKYCYEHGADLYIHKPNNLNDFKTVIEDIVKLLQKVKVKHKQKQFS